MDKMNCAANKVIIGALKNAINAHGPIDGAALFSASKRIIGALESAGMLSEKAGFQG